MHIIKHMTHKWLDPPSNDFQQCEFIPISLKYWKLNGSMFGVVSKKEAEYEVAGIWNPGNAVHRQTPTHIFKPPRFSPISVLRLLQSLQPPLMGFIYDVATPPCVLSPFVTPSFPQSNPRLLRPQWIGCSNPSSDAMRSSNIAFISLSLSLSFSCPRCSLPLSFFFEVSSIIPRHNRPPF